MMNDEPESHESGLSFSHQNQKISVIRNSSFVLACSLLVRSNPLINQNLEPLKHFFHDSWNGADAFIELFGILAAGLGQPRPH